MGYKNEHAFLLALVRANRGVAWHRVANLVDAAGTAEGLVRGEVAPPNAFAESVIDSVRPTDIDDALKEVESWADRDITVWSILDEPGYPARLRSIFDRPPFIFCRGTWRDDDSQGFCVVGTRQATRAGLEAAAFVSRQLSARGLTVLSGLALGVDGAAHRATLESGGRTVAVLGHGLDLIYPPAHRDLADEIVQRGGALISPFTPTQQPNAKYTFAIRNSVMSGLSRGTIVIEAGPTSGAKMQARLALRHGRPVFLLQSLVDEYEWAQEYVTTGRHGSRAVAVSDASAVLDALDAVPDPDAEQLALQID